MSCLVVIPAAGSGVRFGGELPKQFQPLLGRPVIEHTIERFCGIGEVDRIVVAVSAPFEAVIGGIIRANQWNRVEVVPGGETRQDSVLSAMTASVRPKDRFVAIHDSVRPVFRTETFLAVLDAAKECGAALPVLRPRDTIHRVARGYVLETLNRSELAAAQTPQCFAIDVLMPLLERASREGLVFTDEAGLVARFGHRVRVIEGDETNLKITTRDDLARVEAILTAGGDI